MKNMKRLFSLLLVSLLLLSLTGTALAAGEGSYRVRVYGGTQRNGLVLDKTFDANETCNLGDELAAYLGKPVTGTKYYTRSTVRVSGKEEVFTTPSFTVTKDRDFVLTYGIQGDQVRYRVRYVNSNGQNLRDPSDWFYANKGDQVYVAYVEIDGYQPDAYNRTGVLNDSSRLRQSDGSFLFTFTYTRVTTGGGTTTTGGNQGGNVVNPVVNPNQNQNQNANNPVGVNNNPNEQNGQNGQNTPTNNATTDNAGTTETIIGNGPLEIIDEDAVPLAGPDGIGMAPVTPEVISPSNHNRLPTWALVLFAVLLTVLIALLYWYLLFYRKKKKYASDDDIEIIDYDDDF